MSATGPELEPEAQPAPKLAGALVPAGDFELIETGLGPTPRALEWVRLFLSQGP